VGTDQENTLCDTILLALVDRRTKRIGLLSFPRDLWVSAPKVGAMKINAVVGAKVNSKGSLKQGLELLCETLRSEFGIVVDGYARIDVKAFQQVVDAVGGVDVTVPKGPHGKGLHYRDASQKLSIDLDPGPQHLSGAKAMGFVRWRQDNCSGHHGDGDIGRTKRQQEFLKAVTAKVAAKMNASKLSAARTALDMAGIAHRNTTTNLTLSQVQAVASLAREVDRSGIVAKTVPTGASKMIHGQFAFPPDSSGTRKAVKDILAELAAAPSQ
jgi:polyisoprenyl-teichoic acid--peptidoglycan teichoic acid transferase